MPFTDTWHWVSAITSSRPLPKVLPSLATSIFVYRTPTVFAGGEIAGTWTPIILSLITETVAFTVVASRFLLLELEIGTPLFY